MSNIGKLAINLPPKLTIEVQNYDEFQRLIFTNQDGQVKAINLPYSFEIAITPTTLALENTQDNVMWGTVRQHISRIVTGLTTGFTLNLQITGIGYKVAATKKTLNLTLGYSHEIVVEIPQGIEVTCPNTTSITLKSNSYSPLTAFAHSIVAHKPANKDRYKKKGISVL